MIKKHKGHEEGNGWGQVHQSGRVLWKARKVRSELAKVGEGAEFDKLSDSGVWGVSKCV